MGAKLMGAHFMRHRRRRPGHQSPHVARQMDGSSQAKMTNVECADLNLAPSLKERPGQC
jgi:hypothetical protein